MYFEKYGKEWTSKLKKVEVYERTTNENLLTINL